MSSVSIQQPDLSIPDFLRREKGAPSPWEGVPLRETKSEPTKPIVEESPSNDLYANIQKGIRESASLTIGEINGFIDDHAVERPSVYESAYDIMVKMETKGPQAKIVLEHFQPLMEEVQELKARTCPQLNEAYSFLSKAQINRFVDLVGSIITDIERYVSNKKQATVRKPRKKKAKSADKLVAGLKYLQSYPDLKIVSVPPQQIVGAESVWLYNVNQRMLIQLISRTREGLTIKGSTVTGFDEDTSTKKKLRKPEIIIPKVLDGGKVALRKLMDTINSKPQAISGRINNETIILKTMKG